jgi:hypothetical protein
MTEDPEEMLETIRILMDQCQRQRDAIEATLNWYGNDRLIAFPIKDLTEALAAEPRTGAKPVLQNVAIEEAYRLFPDDIEPVDFHPRGRIVVDRGNLRFAFMEGTRFAAAPQM